MVVPFLGVSACSQLPAIVPFRPTDTQPVPRAAHEKSSVNQPSQYVSQQECRTNQGKPAVRRDLMPYPCYASQNSLMDRGSL